MQLSQLLRADVQLLSSQHFVRREFAVRALRLGNWPRAERIARGQADGDADLVFALFMNRQRRDDPDYDAEWDRLEAASLSP